ncbi:MAG: diaminopimelate decarboxylase [Candidatus Schekmanbacteria bacterium]|nr:diaminopimelate decarboxylase [Candidatus Schekmanbacteria bacterium]
MHLGGRNLNALLHPDDVPLFAYHAGRVADNRNRVVAALTRNGVRHRLLYALKANRFVPLLTFMKLRGLCGIDVCSPGELLLALQVGFKEEDISWTSTSLDSRDLACLAVHPRVAVNCDSFDSIRRLAVASPKRAIGLRINPDLGLSYRSLAKLRYSGNATKFGIYQDRFREALALARELGMTIEGLHFHCGCGYLTPQLERWQEILEAAQSFVRSAGPLRYVNVGGGLGVPMTAEDEPVDLDRWADLIRRHLGGGETEVWVEPGTFLVMDSGVLLVRVSSVEQRCGTRFATVNAGFNVMIEPAMYDMPPTVAPLALPRSHDPWERVTVAGNINEALDVFAVDVELPALAPGDRLALLNAGAYASSMSSNHCLRGTFAEYLIA